MHNALKETQQRESGSADVGVPDNESCGTWQNVSLPSNGAFALKSEGEVNRHPANWRQLEVADFCIGPGFRQFEYPDSAHVLVFIHQFQRQEGETLVSGERLCSTRNYDGKMLFAPAGRKIHGWMVSPSITRGTQFFIGPTAPFLDPELRSGLEQLSPRPYTDPDPALRATAIKLQEITNKTSCPTTRLYVEALGCVLAVEIVRWLRANREKTLYRGGLAGWQQRRVRDYLEEHLATDVSLAELANLVNLTPAYFCQAFKQSLGIPPHRYQLHRRIERAKEMMADPSVSLTEIALATGFGSSSHFAVAFRKAAGLSAREYRRQLT